MEKNNIVDCTDGFFEKYNRLKGMVEEELDRLVPMPSGSNLEKTIYDSMRYSLLAGGKRVRPVLMLAVAEILDVDLKDILPFACALEMIHTYSLIHDDLPAMDNDVLRRGKKTNHVVYGEDIAILAGDGLLNKAFEVMADAVVMMENKAAGARILSAIAKCSGASGMIGGQVVDLQSEGRRISLEDLLYMHSKKTGALIEAACTAPALYISDRGSKEYEDFKAFANNLGIAFQIKDDILDVKGDVEVLGKSVGKDEKSEKTTFITFYDVEKCEELLKGYTKNALEILDEYGAKAEFLSDMCDFLMERKY